MHKKYTKRGDGKMAQKTLCQLRQGKEAKVLNFTRGRGLANKLQERGIRPGKKIKKISEAFLGGPVIIEIDNFRIAIGHGMASGILVEVGDE